MQTRGRKGSLGSSISKKATMTSKGIVPNEKPLQDDGMDDELRSKLFTQFFRFYIKPLKTGQPPVYEEEQWLQVNTGTIIENADSLSDGLVNDFIKKPITSYISGRNWDYPAIFRELGVTFFGGPWEDVYYLLSLVVKYYPNKTINAAFMKECNRVLGEENSAYRFVSGKILPKMSEAEIDEVEKATQGSDPSSILLDKAVEKLAGGDSKNAIKEAVLAVETLSNNLSSLPHSTDLKKTLPKVLGRIEKALGEKYNPNLQDTFFRLYDYASSEPGIRHGSKAQPTYAEEAEARFVVVTCSALVNYLRTKADEAGIDITREAH